MFLEIPIIWLFKSAGACIAPPAPPASHRTARPAHHQAVNHMCAGRSSAPCGEQRNECPTPGAVEVMKGCLGRKPLPGTQVINYTIQRGNWCDWVIVCKRQKWGDLVETSSMRDRGGEGIYCTFLWGRYVTWYCGTYILQLFFYNHPVFCCLRWKGRWGINIRLQSVVFL